MPDDALLLAQQGVAEEIDAAIEADPSNANNYLVYADWLQARGDSRGELIALQHATLQHPADESLRSAERASIQRHTRALLGEIYPQALEITWRLGFVESVRIPLRLVSAAASADALDRLLMHPASRFVREISLGAASPPTEYQRFFDAVRRTRQARTLRTLRLGEDNPILGDLTPLFDAAPALSRLVLSGRKLRLVDTEAPSLVELVLENLDLDTHGVEGLASTRWPKLEALSIRRSWYAGSWVDRLFAHLSPVLAPRLRSISVSAAHLRYGENAVEPALRLALLPQLELLDLDLPLGEREISELIHAAKELAHLRRIRLREGNDIAAEVRRELAARLPAVEWSAFGSPAGSAALDPPRFEE